MSEYIEREKLQEALQRKKSGPATIRYTDGWNDCLMRVKSMVHSAPAADVAPVRRGHWIDMQEDDQTEGMWRCSCCGDDRYFYKGHPREYEFKFCPNCGARMDGGDDDGE